MPWPKSTDYIEAVQNLHHSMADEELLAGQLTVNPLGLPMVWSGGFADVYKIHNAANGNSWALKCFTKKVAGQAERYQHISDHLTRARLPFMVDFTYLDRGICVHGEWYPALKMHWVEDGIRLNEFVEQYLNRPRTLKELLRIWVKMADRLRQAAVGHCDLQHGNVLMVPRDGGSLALRLIDYDGIHVPSLAGTHSPELGHPAFQHPQRSRERIYSAEVDRFSHLAIYTSIHCLTVGREELWKRFNNSENLLFREEDYRRPAESEAFRTLWKLPDTGSRTLVGRLALACEKPLDQVPLLDAVATEQTYPLTQAEEQAVDSLLGSAATSHPVAVAESTEGPSASVMPEWMKPESVPTDESHLDVSREAARKRRNPWRLALVFLEMLDWPLKKIAREENEILHNFLRIMAAVALVMLIVMAASMVPQWIGNARHSAADTEVVGMFPETAPEAIESPEPPVELPENYTNGIGMQFKLIPAGEFMMGSRTDDPGRPDHETPQHRVRITKPFYLGIFEVTQAEYEKVMGANPSHFEGSSRPVEQVSWEDATEFCTKLSEVDEKNAYRLPREAEWEYACRAGTTTRYSCGDELEPEYAWFQGNSGEQTHPVGEKRPNAWGLHDMHGNLYELCADWYAPDFYGRSPLDDPVGPLTGSRRVSRGGGWPRRSRSCRAASRAFPPAGWKCYDQGFRVVAVPLSLAPAQDDAVSPSPPELRTPRAPAPPPEPANALPEGHTNAIGMQFKLIRAGEFMMGSPADDPSKEDDETPQHRVRITNPFYLGVYEVTQEEYEKVIGENPSSFKGSMRPVENVSWEDAAKFCTELSEIDTDYVYRLPTEAEWEYACRAGTSTRHSCGDDLESDYAWFRDNSSTRAHPVGEKLPNAFGLYDMHGNVMEWCQDWYDSSYYGSSLSEDPPGPTTGSGRVYRDGGWSGGARNCRSADRSGLTPDDLGNDLGFRVVAVPVSVASMPEATAVLPVPGSKAVAPLKPTPFIRGTSGAAYPTSDFGELPMMQSTLGVWTNDDQTRNELFRQIRAKARRGLTQYECRRLIPVPPGYSGYHPPDPGTRGNKTLPQRFVLSGELVAVRVHKAKGYVFLTASRPRRAPDINAFLQSLSSHYQQPSPMIMIQFDTVALPTWMSDYRFGEAVHAVVQRQSSTRSQHGSQIDPYQLPPLARDAVSEFKPIFIQNTHTPTMCWCFVGEGLEKANRPETWVDSENGRSGTLANTPDVRVSPEFLLRSGAMASGISAAVSAEVRRFTSAKGSVTAYLTTDTSTEASAELAVSFGPGVEIREFLDYEAGGLVELTATVADPSPPRVAIHTYPPGDGQPKVIPFASRVAFAGGRIRMQGDPATAVVVGSPPRDNVKIKSTTPEVAQAEPGDSVGNSVIWNGRLSRLHRQDGNVHLVVSLSNSLTGLRYFEAYTNDGAFYDSLIDYVPSDASSKADTVEIVGSVRPVDAISHRLQQNVPLLEIRGVRRPDDPESAAIVGRPRSPTTFRQETIRKGLSAIYHDRPPVGTEVEFSAVFGRYDERNHVVEVSSDGSHERVKIDFPGSNKSRFSDYRRRDVVEVKAKVANKEERGFRLSGLEIVRTKNPRSRVTRAGRAIRALDLSSFKDRWRKIRYKAKDHLGEQFTGCGLFAEATTDTTAGKPSTSILVKSLFFESSSYTITLVGPLRDDDQSLVNSFTIDEEVLFEFRVLRGSSSSKAKGELLWISRIGDPNTRAESAGSD